MIARLSSPVRRGTKTKSESPSRSHTVDGASLLVFDSFLHGKELRDLCLLLEKAPFRRLEADSERTPDVLQWVLELKVPSLLEKGNALSSTMDRLQGLLDVHFAKLGKGKPYRAYCNNIAYGDMSYTHTDSDPDEPTVTALLYVSNEWKRDWAGETIFFDHTGDATVIVAPRPGRLALFEGHIPHRAGVPARDCHRTRLSLAIKFVFRKKRTH